MAATKMQNTPKCHKALAASYTPRSYRKVKPLDYETVIGLEVHVQLLTESKMFCSCSARYQGAPPNSHVCPVCLGMPGVLPVVNRRAVEHTIATGLALDCSISDITRFDRKNYPYPDLMKGYQISQYQDPIAHNGHLDLEFDGYTRRIGVERVHLEEDVAKLQHVTGDGDAPHTLVDVNRSGVPLMEVVSHPDMRSAEEARLYLMSVHAILQYTGVSTANMQEGNFRCDTNISLRPKGTDRLGAKVEVKNLNSFRSVYHSLKYEVERQARVLDEGGRVEQETRGWSEDKGVSFSQRSKEFAHDYRYFPEPDLPPLTINRDWVEQVRDRLPELPAASRHRFSEQYGLSAYDADLLTTSKAMSEFFESAVAHEAADSLPTQVRAKMVGNWLITEVNGLLNSENKDIEDCPLSPASLAELASLVGSGILNSSLAKAVLEEAFYSAKMPRDIVSERGYVQVSDTGIIDEAVRQALETNPEAVEDFLGGKETASKYLMGQVMKISKGKANPALAGEVLAKQLQAKRSA